MAIRRFYLNMGYGVATGIILKTYTWGYLMQVGTQCYKIAKQDVFDTFEAAKTAQLEEVRKIREAKRRGYESVNL